MIGERLAPAPSLVMARKLAATAPRPETAAETTALLDELRACAAHDRMAELITSICDSDRLLAECSSNSVSHPLGFDKLTLVTTPAYQLKLHIWWPTTSPRTVEDIHDHRFSFASVVLAGTLKTEIFRLDEAGTPMRRFTEHRDAYDGSYVFDPAGVIGVGQREVSIMAARSAYFMNAEVLHRVSVEENALAATLFLKLRPVRHNTTVLVDRRTTTKHTRSRAGLDPRTTRRKLLDFTSTTNLT